MPAPNVSLENAEYVALPQEVGDEALAGFHTPAEERIQLQSFMDGRQYANRAEQLAAAQGMTTQHTDDAAFLVEQQELQRLAAEQRAQAMPPQPTQPYLAQPPNVPQHVESDDNRNWQQLYGRSENEKGELRRQLQELMQMNQQLMATQAQAYSTPPPQFFGAPAGNGYPSPAPQQAPSWSAAPNPQSYPRIVPKADGEMILAEDLEGTLRDSVAPFIFGVARRAEEAEQRATQAQRQLFEMQKVNMGVTPQVEQHWLSTAPWVRNIADPSAYLSTINQLETQRRMVTQLQQQAPQPIPQAQQLTPQGQPAQRQISRRMSFIEGGGHGGGVDIASTRSAEQVWQEEWAKTLTLPYGSNERTAAQKALLVQRGASQVTGYRDPSVSTR